MVKNIATILNNELLYLDVTNFKKEDPVGIPHLFTVKQDIEIAGFFSAIIAWGQRTSIITNANKLMQGMDMEPWSFVKSHTDTDLLRFEKFVHRTFNFDDLLYFFYFLKFHYTHNLSLEMAFKPANFLNWNMEKGLIEFNRLFFSHEHLTRTKKHIASPLKKSACKRLNLYLKWMVRKDATNLDLGIWENINPSDLLIPLDVHVHKASLHLGLTKRTQADFTTVLEITEQLKKISMKDPIKYDFALFNYGKKMGGK